jgi:hypothetical protein
MATSSSSAALSIPYDQYQDLIKGTSVSEIFKTNCFADKESLEKQIRDLKRSLASESKERDVLEKEAFDLGADTFV